MGIAPVASAPQGTAGRPLHTMHSLLMVDCGSVYTKVALIGLVEGRYRLLARAQAPTTIAPPAPDVLVGVREAIGALERATGRALLREGRLVTPEQEDGVGVDGLSLATSVGGPLRLLTSGPGREALAGLLQHAIGGLFVLSDTLPHGVPLQADSPDWQAALAQVAAFHPHALVMVGAPFAGTRGQATLDDTLALARHWLDALGDPASPAAGERIGKLPVVFTGSAGEASAVTGALEGHARSVHAVEALSPSTLLPLSHAIGSLYEAAVLRVQPGYMGLRALAGAPPTACITALAGMARYLARHFQTNVVAVDVGASATSLCGGTTQGDFLPASHPTAGVGPGAGSILRARGAQNVLRWLARPVGEDELREYALTRQLRPRLLPTSAAELELEHALAREAIGLALRAPGSRVAGLYPMDVLLGTGGVLANVPDPAMAALVLLDALQPRGISSLVLDTGHIANMLGGVAALDSASAAEVAEADAVLLQLGTCVSPVGSAADGEPVLRVTLEFGDGRTHVEDVAQGTLVRLPLAPNEQALLTLQPAPSVDVGLGPGQQARTSDPVAGGALGLLIDARGRSLALPQDPEARVRKQAEWRRALGLEA